MLEKSALREQLRHVRRRLPPLRRAEAEQKANETLLDLCQNRSLVLSYFPFDGELDVTPLNHELAKEKRLVLPHITGTRLILYRVDNLSSSLLAHRYGFHEPNPAVCPSLEADRLSLALVPGVGFTRHNHRLGFGKGYYDRFLHTLACSTIGVGFKEQMIDAFPYEKFDIPLSQIILF